LAVWKNFKSEVLRWFQTQKVNDALTAAVQVPVWPHKKMLEEFPYAAPNMNVLRIGGEISVSSLFDHNILRPVQLCVLSLNHAVQVPESKITPDEPFAFGDSKIIPKVDYVKNQEPDVVMILYPDNRRGDPRLRLVGELKSFITVDINNMVDMAMNENKPFRLKNLLGRSSVT
jgi:hypothetical protein